MAPAIGLEYATKRLILAFHHHETGNRYPVTKDERETFRNVTESALVALLRNEFALGELRLKMLDTHWDRLVVHVAYAEHSTEDSRLVIGHDLSLTNLGYRQVPTNKDGSAYRYVLKGPIQLMFPFMKQDLGHRPQQYARQRPASDGVENASV